MGNVQECGMSIHVFVKWSVFCNVLNETKKDRKKKDRKKERERKKGCLFFRQAFSLIVYVWMSCVCLVIYCGTVHITPPLCIYVWSDLTESPLVHTTNL